MEKKSEPKKPIYSQIADDIRQDIEDKVFLADERLPSEAQLAGQYNVSRITSQKALNVLENEGLIYRIKGSGSFVSDSNHSKKPKESLNMIAIILPFNSVYGGGMDILSGVESIAGKNNYYVSLHNSQGSTVSEREIILQLLEDGVEGIIYYPMYTSENFDLLSMLTNDRYPIVMIDKHIDDIPIDSVVSENFDAGYSLTQHLIEKGHRNIAFVSGEPIDQLSSTKERFLGYFEAFKDNGISFNIDNMISDFPYYKNLWAIDDVESPKFYKKLFEFIINDKKDITCIQAISDRIAIELLKAAHQLNVRVPNEISIVGFDNLDLTALITPGITTVNQNLFEMGAKGAELAISRIQKPHKPFENIRLPMSLVKRESVATIKSNISDNII